MAEQDESFQHKANGPEAEDLGDIEAVRRALAEEEEKAANYLSNWQRAQADLINYRRRAEQEKKETVEFANRLLILNLLTVMDDFERAFTIRPTRTKTSGWIEGIGLIYNKLKAVVEAQGLVEIKAKGQPFDPHLHEAVMRQEGEEGIVIEETRTGYKLKDRVIRPSMVLVGPSREPGEPSPQEE